MSTGDHWKSGGKYGRLSGVRERCPRRWTCDRARGEVPLAQLMREIDAAARRFWARRGRCDAGTGEYCFGRKRGTGNAQVRDVALAYLAIPSPERGTMKRMADSAGLRYHSVASMVYAIRVRGAKDAKLGRIQKPEARSQNVEVAA